MGLSPEVQMKTGRARPDHGVRDNNVQGLSHMITHYPQTTDVAGIVLGYLLHALGVHQRYDFIDTAGLPEATVHVEDRGIVLSVTSKPAPALRDIVETLATDAQYDVVLTRVARKHCDVIELSVDLTLGLLPCAPWSMNDLAVWTGQDGETWLVPLGIGPAVSLTFEGCSLELVPPYHTLEERASGILRAGADIASLLPLGEVQ